MKFTVASAQYPITYFNHISEWILHTQKWVEEAIKYNANLILFPEYGSMELTSLLSKTDQQSLNLQLKGMQSFLNSFTNTFYDLAIKNKCVIIAPSFPDCVNEIYINRAFVFFPDGSIQHQDKQIMTRFENEEWSISPGENLVKVFNYQDIKFGINICYDGEFPIFAQKQTFQGMQLLLHPSCTEGLAGMERVHIGARARALENQIYVVVSQTIGNAPWSIAVDKNNGKAAFYSTCDNLFPHDGIIKIGELNKAGWIVQELDFDLINEVRESGQVLNYKDINKSLNR